MEYRAEIVERMKAILGPPRYTMVGEPDYSKFRPSEGLSDRAVEAKVNARREP